MRTKHTPWAIALNLVALAAVTSACASSDAGGTQTASEDPSPVATAENRFDSLDDLYANVDDVLGCPESTSAPHVFKVEGGIDLTGRQCGGDLIMAWSDDQNLIASARNLVEDTSKPVPVAYGADWFVADVQFVAEGHDGASESAELRDLAELSAELDGEYHPE